MAIEKAKEFLLALKEKGADKAWTEKAAKAKTEEEKLAVVVDMAREMGYDLTAEDIKEALSGLKEGENDLVPLDDDEVESVAGGAQPPEGDVISCLCMNCGLYRDHVYTGVFRPGVWFLTEYQYQCKDCGSFSWIWSFF